jgi:hypothetical protein
LQPTHDDTIDQQAFRRNGLRSALRPTAVHLVVSSADGQKQTARFATLNPDFVVENKLRKPD